MKKLLYVLSVIFFSISLTACVSEFDGSRKGNDSEFIMEYKMLNTTDSQDLKLEAGDTINAKIGVDSGNLSIKIQKDDEQPVYEGDDISASDEFGVAIEKSGTYTISVTGKKTKGSISFTTEARKQ